MAFQHVTCRSSAHHLRDLRCSPPLLDRLYRPIALHFDTLHVRRRPLLVQKSYISCWPVSCLHCSRSSIGIRPAFTGAFASRILWAGRIHLLSPGTVVVFVAQHDGRASVTSVLGPPSVYAIIYIVVPRDLHVVLAVIRKQDTAHSQPRRPIPGMYISSLLLY